MSTHHATLVVLATIAATSACAGTDESVGAEDGRCPGSNAPSRFASCIDAFSPGPGAGFGQQSFPTIAFGPPEGGGPNAGSTDVLSLGRRGSIVLGFGASRIVDGPGPDLIVFENPFYIGGRPDRPFAEPGEVAVSDDGLTWATFPCESDRYPYRGCAGWHAVVADNAADALDPSAAGGDPFDLADIGIEQARFVRIVDVSESGSEPTAGFDLDAVAAVNTAVR